MKRFIVTAGTAIVMCVVGCSSFNNSFNTYTMHPGHHQPVVVKDDTSAPDESPALLTNLRQSEIKPDLAPIRTPVLEAVPSNTCPKFIAPVTPKQPELPYREIAEAGKDQKKLETVLVNHIDQLRLFNVEKERIWRGAVKQYEARCKQTTKP